MPEIKKSELDMYIANRVKDFRLKHDMSQTVLAIKLGVSSTFIGQVEVPTHPSKYNLAHLNKLAMIFEISPRELLPEKPII